MQKNENEKENTNLHQTDGDDMRKHPHSLLYSPTSAWLLSGIGNLSHANHASADGFANTVPLLLASQRQRKKPEPVPLPELVMAASPDDYTMYVEERAQFLSQLIERHPTVI